MHSCCGLVITSNREPINQIVRAIGAIQIDPYDVLVSVRRFADCWLSQEVIRQNGYRNLQRFEALVAFAN